MKRKQNFEPWWLHFSENVCTTFSREYFDDDDVDDQSVQSRQERNPLYESKVHISLHLYVLNAYIVHALIL